MGGDVALQRVQRHPAFLDLHNPVRAPEQAETITVRMHPILAGPPIVRLRQMRGAHPQAVVLDAPVDARQGAPRRLFAVPAPPGNAAGLAAAVNLRRRHAQALAHLQRGFGRQRTAGGEHRPHAPTQSFPIQLLRQPFQVRRAGHQQRRLSTQRNQQIFVEERPRRDRPTGRQWPEHAEQQAVDVLMRDRAVDGRTAQLRAERGFQRFHFPRQLVQAFLDGDRLTGAAGCEHHQPGGRFIQRGQGNAVVSARRRQAALREIARESVHPPCQAFPGRRKVVGAQEYPLAGMPGPEQRGRECQRVVKVERPVAPSGRGECRLPIHHPGPERRMVPPRRHPPSRHGVDRHPIQWQPLTHVDAPPARAGAPATRPRTAPPSAGTRCRRCRAPRCDRWSIKPLPAPARH